MMKLKNLVADTTLVAKKAMENWEYDNGTLKFWSGSSNTLYYFEHKNEGYFLRLSHEEDATEKKICGELDFLIDLGENNYNSSYPVITKRGNFYKVIETDLGAYYAVVFKQLKGKPIDVNEFNEKNFEDWGKALGKLHKISQDYIPMSSMKRRSWKDIINFSRDVLSEFPHEKEAIEEVNRVEEWLSSLHITNENYGLIHYDFEPDNVFWDKESNTFNVIDFDDSMYHWYVMDIMNTLDEVKKIKDDNVESEKKAFLRGYSSVKDIDKELINETDKFQRFYNVYTFTRLIRSLEGNDFKEKPDWLESVRLKLTSKCNKLRKDFDKTW